MANPFANYIHDDLRQIAGANQMLLDKVGAIKVELKSLKEESRRSYEERTTFQKAVFGLLFNRLNGDAPCNLCSGVLAAQLNKVKEVSDEQFASTCPMLKSPPPLSLVVSFVGGGSFVQRGMGSHGGESVELCPDSFVREFGEGV